MEKVVEKPDETRPLIARNARFFGHFRGANGAKAIRSAFREAGRCERPVWRPSPEAKVRKRALTSVSGVGAAAIRFEAGRRAFSTVHACQRSIWDQVLGRIEAKVGSPQLPHLVQADLDAGWTTARRVSVRVPNPLFTEWLPKHYSVVLAEALQDVGRANTELVFVPEEAKAGSAAAGAAAGARLSRDRTSRCSAPSVTGRPQPALHVRYLHRRTVEPVCARGLPRGRRSAVALVQPAVHLRRRRSRQDALDARHRALRAAAHPRLQAHLHLVRTIHERDDQRGALRPHSRFSRALSHASTCCSSTTSSSSRARKARRTSSSTRSTRCTTRRSRSSSAAIGRRTKSPRSRSVCDRDSSGD